MTDILASDIKFLRCEREAGGYPTANEVLDNVENQVFEDIASGERVVGYTEIAKIAAAVRNPTNEELLSGRVYIATPPDDAAVSVALFPCNAADEKDDLLDVLYAHVQRGGNTNFRLLTNYGPGAERIGLYAAKPPNQSAIAVYPSTSNLVLVDTILGSEEVVSITPDGGGSDDDIVIYYFKLSKPLTQTFGGELFFSAARVDDKTDTQIYEVNSQPIQVYGIQALAAQADVDDTQITVSSNAVTLGSRISLEQSAAKSPEGNSSTSYPYQFVAVTAAANARAQILPVVGGHTVLRKVTYRYKNEWFSDFFSLNGSAYFTVILSHKPDAGSDLIYYASNPAAFYLTGTDFVFIFPSPVIPGSVTLTALSEASSILSVSDNGAGGFTGDVSSGSIDYATGLATVTLSASCPIADVIADLRFTTYADDLGDVGIDLAKLPPGKTAPIFRVGETVIVSHLQHETLTNPLAADTTYPLARSDVNQIWLEAADGTRIPTAQYTVNLVAGSIHTIVGLDLSGYQQPIEAYTTISDEVAIVGIADDGVTLILSQAVTHTYPAPGSYVSSILSIGDVGASVSVPFEQQAWSDVWSDTRIGNEITPQFDTLTYPIIVTNAHTITERWRLSFVGTTTVDVIGEHRGKIATNLSILEDIAPVNPLTGGPYFTIPYQGWGAGWVNGHQLRLNTSGADQPLGVLRCVQPSPHQPGISNRFRLSFTGDTDAN